jgi:NhaA family Na+:H+ antiporter
VAVIAVGYPGSVSFGWLAAALAGCLLVVLMRRVGITAVWPYLPVAVVVWYATLQSGVHATVAAVALALLTPAGDVGGRPVLQRLLKVLAPVSAFVAVPIFALANAGVRLDLQSVNAAAGSRVTWAVLAGLLVGKFIGVVGTIALATATRLGRLPDGVTRTYIAGLGLIAGLGFTVALFITELAYTDPALTEQAKIGVLVASAIAATAAAVVLATAIKPPRARSTTEQGIDTPAAHDRQG